MKKKLMIILILLLATAGYLHYQNTSLQITPYTVTSSELPEVFDGFKIVQVSDFHNTGSAKLTDCTVAQIRTANPDLIAITGDLVDSRRTDVDRAVNFVRRLTTIAPVYYVTGNHESRIAEYQELKMELEALSGVMILENESVTLRLEDQAIELVGIDDPQMAYRAGDNEEDIARQALEESEYNSHAFKILLSHRPELLNLYVEEKMNLVLSGHAHGGQIRLPFVGGLIAPNQGLLPKYDGGAYSKDETVMIVSRGIGNSLFPFRVNNRPELVVVRLMCE